MVFISKNLSEIITSIIIINSLMSTPPQRVAKKTLSVLFNPSLIDKIPNIRFNKPKILPVIREREMISEVN
jgi:hypothetical protein